VCECLRSGDDIAGAPDRVQVGGSYWLDPLCFADDVVVGPYQQGSRVGWAGIRKRPPSFGCL